MQLVFEPFELSEAEALLGWLSSDRWPYHVARCIG
jgi:hypothetical protein